MKELHWLFEGQEQSHSDMEIRQINSGISFKLKTSLARKYAGEQSKLSDFFFDIAFLCDEIALKISTFKKTGVKFSGHGDLNLSRNIGHGNKYYDTFKFHVGKYRLDRVEDNIMFFKKEG